MSCLRLRFPPARKAWKSFTSKLHSKLHKPKAINKSRNRLKPATTISIRLRSYKFLQLHFQRRPRISLSFRHNRPRLLQTRHTHVYVDKLFKEPAVSKLVAEFSQKPKSPLPKRVVQPITECSVPENREAERVTSAADDMWESMGFASPQMHGIDRRAEEFIARFRAEMKDQEKLARRRL